MLRLIAVYILSVVVGAVLVSIANTHVDLQALTTIGADIPTDVRIQTIGRDLAGFGPTLAGVLMLGFLIAFPVAAGMSRLLGPAWRRFGYSLAGAVAVAAIMYAVKLYYGVVMDSAITPIAASRTLGGLATLSLGGAAAGFLFAWMTPAPGATPTD